MIRKGSCRWVFLIGNLAFKLPSMHSWRNFLWGLLANLQEREFSQVKEMQNKLCPVIFWLPLGFLIVMPKARPLKPGEITKETMESFVKGDNFIVPAEMKPDSFGYVKGKLVVIDYG